MVERMIVTEWRGMHVGAYGRPTTRRRALDVPRLLVNTLVDRYGHLWIPPEGDLLYALEGATGIVRKIAAVRRPDGLLVQVGDDVWYVPRDTETPRIVATFTDTGLPMWVASMTDSDGAGDPVEEGFQGTTLFGNSTQTFALRWPDPGVWDDAEAFEVTAFESPPGPDEETPRAAMVNGRHSFAFRGRRYVAEGQGAGSRRVWFSELNAPLNFQAPDDTSPLNYFDVGGDDVGPDISSYIGELRGFAALEDVLVIFLSQSIWVLTGSGPDSFNLRRTQSQVGCISIETVVQVDRGLMFVGALPNGEPGVYLFTGSASQRVSDDIGALFQGWESTTDKYPPNVVEDDAEDTFSATRWENQYVLCAPAVSPDAPLMVYDIEHQRWSLHEAGANPRVGNLYGLVVGDDSHELHITQEQMIRFGDEALIELGWHDDAVPAGHVRFLAAKLFGRGADTEIDVAFSTPDTTAPVERALELTDDVFDGHVLPIALRGHALEMLIAVTPDGQATVESLEVIMSRKGEKVSRS